jgi:hypothetical protein
MTEPLLPQTALPLWRRRWVAPASVAAVFIALFIWTWQTWADLLIDFGVQLYVPWQITQGKVLYRDIAHYTGPLSVYYNALAFKIFGVNLRVLEFANLPILIATTVAIYKIASRLGGKLCAVVCSVSFLVLFAFAHLTIAGNYNFVCPYEYEYTHATLLALLCVIFLTRLVTQPKPLSAAIAGFLAGMIFLTRSEFFVAIVAATAITGLLLLVANWRKLPLAALAFMLGFAIPPLISILSLHLALPWSMAMYRTLGMWPALLRGNVSSQHFYLHSMGIDDLHSSLQQLYAWSLRWCIPLAGFTAWASLKTSRKSPPILFIAFLLGAIFAGLHWRSHESALTFWPSMFRPLPLALAIVAAASIFQFISGMRRETNALIAILSILSLALLAKVFFYARIIHYGVWLAMPGVMLLLAVLFGSIPATLARHERNPAIFIAGMGGVWLSVLLVHLAITKTQMSLLSVSVGSGADQFWADAKTAPVVNNALLIAQQLPAGKTLACFPEGIMINYLARRPAATRYVNFNPPDLLLFGQDQVIRAMQANPPDYIFIVHKDTSEFEVRFFGQDYAQNLFAWIESNYMEVRLPIDLDLGAEPLKSSRFGIRLLVPRPGHEGQQRMILNPDIYRGRNDMSSIIADSTSNRE